MFRSLTLRGSAAEVTWGSGAAADLRMWAVTKKDGAWSLTARVMRADAFRLRQRPLRFTAPRPGGFFYFPIVPDSIVVQGSTLTATLGPPER